MVLDHITLIFFPGDSTEHCQYHIVKLPKTEDEQPGQDFKNFPDFNKRLRRPKSGDCNITRT
jgi:hypothetical protein